MSGFGTKKDTPPLDSGLTINREQRRGDFSYYKRLTILSAMEIIKSHQPVKHDKLIALLTTAIDGPMLTEKKAILYVKGFLEIGSVNMDKDGIVTLCP